MNDVTVEMIKIYGTYKFDWMNYKICKDDLTYHHIIKKENGGKLTIENGALLTKRAHEYLHSIERLDVDLYERINNVLKEINDQKKSPSTNQREKINLLLLEFEIKYADKIIKKCKKLGKKRVMVATNRRIQSQKSK